jgi:phosphoglycerate dehydrogenase-like enzyme
VLKLDRKTQKGEYKLEKGFELKGKTLGIIGVGSIGSTLAQLANGIGMKVIGYNRSPKTVDGVEMKNSLNELLAESDAISLHLTHEEENNNMISVEQIAKMRNGIIIVNLADRENIDENAMANALKSGKVFGYAYEGENLENTPLAGLDNAIGLKGFGWYTTEALANLFQIWTDNIASMANNKPQNVIT